MEGRVKVKLLAMAGIVVVLAISVALLYYTGHIGPKHPHIATVEEIREEVNLLKQSKGYKDGGVYLAELERPGVVLDPKSLEVDFYRSYCIDQRILVDFVSTYTPEQVEIIRDKGGLPFACLSPEQQRLLLLLYKYSASGIFKEADIRHSAFLFTTERTGFIHMNWIVTKTDGTSAKLSYGLADFSGPIANSAKRARNAQPHKIHP